jgi:hypothetical protein
METGMFSMWSVPRSYLENNWDEPVSANVRNTGQDEPRHTKYKRLKLDGGKAYDRSSD